MKIGRHSETNTIAISKKSVIVSFLAIFAVFGLLLAKSGEMVRANDAEQAVPLRVANIQNGFADLIEEIAPTVVTISVEQLQKKTDFDFEDDFRRFFDQFPEMDKFFDKLPGDDQIPRQGSGSGFVVDSSGYIVTNAHVVNGADALKVTLSDDTVYDAKIIGIDELTDLAVIKIDADRKLIAAKFGNSEKSRVGDWVIAIGTPFGLQSSVSLGIISGKGRSFANNPDAQLIQIDAAVNQGNSGGPLFNSVGEVIGVNTMIMSRTGENAGVALAIPSALAEDISSTLIQDGRIERGFLGVVIQDVTEDIAEAMQLEEAKGALVAEVVDGSPAAVAGVEVGDVILNFNDEDIAEMRELPRVVRSTKPGTEVGLEVWRDGDTVSLTIAIGNRNVAGKETEMASREKDTSLSIGIELAEISAENRQRFEIDEDTTGVVVLDVEQGSAAAQSGIREGDVIKSINRESIDSIDDAQQNLNAATESGKNNILMLIERNGGSRFVTVSAS